MLLFDNSSSMVAVMIVSLLLLLGPAAAAYADCSGPAELGPGPFGPTKFLNTTDKDGTMFFGALPSNGTGGPHPLVVFMHGSTGQWEMYEENMYHYASHGFVVVFPFIKSPQGDKNPLTTNTNGEYILKGVAMAKAGHADPKSPLYGLVDVTNIAVAGHSMGATCSIMAGVRLPAGTAKVLITQHPGICGPFGPPPWPSTWLKSDLGKANQKLPILFTTATNDGAFCTYNVKTDETISPIECRGRKGCQEGRSSHCVGCVEPRTLRSFLFS